MLRRFRFLIYLYVGPFGDHGLDRLLGSRGANLVGPLAFLKNGFLKNGFFQCQRGVELHKRSSVCFIRIRLKTKFWSLEICPRDMSQLGVVESAGCDSSPSAASVLEPCAEQL